MLRTLALVLAVGVVAQPAAAQNRTERSEPGFNLFTVQQDVELGRQSALEAEKQLRLLNDRQTDAYLNRIVQRLAATAPGARYPYSIKAVNATDVNAFALPGGPMYVNRGLIQTARNEAELAGVLAHEMAHVAMRHGTHQASKAYLSQAGLGILGGLIGRSSNTTAKIVNSIGGVGLNAVFLKFSRDDEYEADKVGVEIMEAAGYDPRAMASFFALLRAEHGRDPGKLEQFFSSHPSPANRETRIRQLAGSPSGAQQVVGGFTSMQSRLGRLPPASGQRVALQEAESDEPLFGQQVTLRVPMPSSRFQEFSHPQDYFTIDHPDNWRAYSSGLALSLAPEGGVVTNDAGQQVILYGVIINHYAPFEGAESRRSQSLQRSYAPFEDRSVPRGTLEDATDDLVRTILDANEYLRTETGSARAETIDGAPAFRVRLSGTSPVTGQEEQVTVVTRGLTDGHVIYLLGVVPGSLAGDFNPVFQRMVRTLSVNDAAAHRAQRITSR